jgi:hypothetical protein
MATKTPTTSKPLRSIDAIIEDLTKPIAKRHLKKKRQGGSDLTFIPWYHAVKYLDLYAPGWTYKVTITDVPGGHIILVNNRIVKSNEFKKDGAKPDAVVQMIPKSQVAVVAAITIPCLEGFITRESTGQEDAEVTGFGDSTSNSESMALRRAASKFGLGLYLYNKE